MPLLSAQEKQSVDIGVKFFKFQYHYHCCVLLRSHKKWRKDCVKSSREAVGLLDGLVSDSNEVYNGVVWCLLYCPFTPFFVLFGEVLSSGDATSRKLSLEAMQHLPNFMVKMAPRHPQAAKLHQISSSLVQQAKSVLAGKTADNKVVADESTGASTSKTQTQQEAASVGGAQDFQMSNIFDSSSILNFFNEPPMSVRMTGSNLWTPDSMTSGSDLNGSVMLSDTLPEGVELSNMFMQSDFDWFAWDTSIFGMNDSYYPF